MALWNMLELLQKQDSTTSFAQLKTVGSESSNALYDLKCNWLLARTRIHFDISRYAPAAYTDARHWLMVAKAKEADVLAAEWADLAGQLANFLDLEEEALFYLAEAIHLNETSAKGKMPFPFHSYGTLGMVLFELGDYDACAYISRRALQLAGDRIDEQVHMNGWNTIGVCYRRMGRFDSARLAFDYAMSLARKQDNQLWKGIISGNYGQLYLEEGKLDSARLLMLQDYAANKAYGEWPNVAQALQWLARIDLAESKPQQALKNVRESLALLKAYPRNDYLELSWLTASDVHRALGQADSAKIYFDAYQHLRDSTSQLVRPNLFELATQQVRNTEALRRIDVLQQKQQTERHWRNGLILLVLIVSAAAIWIQSAIRRRNEAERNLLRMQAQAAEAEISSARDKLSLFAQSLMEKNEALASMEKQLASAKPNPDAATLRELTETTLLTDNDWNKFRQLLEGIFPGYLLRVKNTYPGITPAELRMAALIRLNLSAKEMGAMLGISTISVYKSRQRLRQRVGVEADEDLEALISTI
jgi:tetratricopeptide (TPR) repeat protein